MPSDFATVALYIHEGQGMAQVIALAPTVNAAQSADFTVAGVTSVMIYSDDPLNTTQNVGQLTLLRKVGANYYPVDGIMGDSNRDATISGAGTYAVKKGATPFAVGVAVDLGTAGGGGTVTSDDITDATTVGKAVLTAADAAAARTAIGAGIVKPPTAGLADTATALATGRTFALTGAITGTSAAFTGAANASIATTINVAGIPGYNVAGTFNLQLVNGVLTFTAAT